MQGNVPQKLPEIFTHADALALGVSDRTLCVMRDSGEIGLLARGIYAQPTLEADFGLIEIAIRTPAALCLTSTLAHHDLIADIPSTINVALPRLQRAFRTAPTPTHSTSAEQQSPSPTSSRSVYTNPLG